MNRIIKSAFVTISLVAGISGSAFAQSSAGAISGQAMTGDTIIVDGNSTGFHREITVEKDGKYRVSGVPTGEYIVTKKPADGSTVAPTGIRVVPGGTARVK